MPKPAPEPATEIPPPARDAVAALIAAPRDPVKILVSGGIGSGKSSVLAAVRSALRTAGVAVLTRPPRSGDEADAAVVIDDAHLLDDGELDQLVDRVADPASTIVVATEPLAHRPALRALGDRHRTGEPRRVARRVEPTRRHAAIATEILGAAPTPEIVRALMVSTAGLPFLLQPAIAAAASREGESPATAIAQAASFTLIERLRRLDEPVLDTLLVTSLSPDLGPDDVAATLRVGAAGRSILVDRARASGLIEPSHSHTFLRSLHSCIAQIIGTARHHDIEIALLVSQIESSTLSADLALRMAEHGLRDDRLANCARRSRVRRATANPQGQQGFTVPPPMQERRQLSSRLADALALTGDCATAGRIADELLGSEDATERAAAVRIAASVAVHDGSSAQAADLFRWLGPVPGRVRRRRRCDRVARRGRSARRARVAQRRECGSADVDLTRGAQPRRGPAAVPRGALPVGGRTARAVDHRRTAADGRRTRYPRRTGDARRPARRRSGAGPQRDRPRGARIAWRTARRTRRSSRAGTGCCWGGCGCWTASWAPRRADVTAVTADTESALHRRDALWAAALQTAIARRSGDSGAVQKHWYAAMEVLAEYSMDLYSLLPLGELWVAAARMRQVDRLQHTLDEAFALLDSLGNPLLWSVPLHWAGVHAGILANSPEAVAPHGQALTAAAAQSTFAKALSTAGRTWLRVLANHVDTDEVSGAARSLSQFGLTWDATRLAGQAALHTPDGRVSGAMLQLARDLKQSAAIDATPDLDAPATVDTSHSGPTRPASTKLSDREREVAELLLLGMPYRDIGTQLFISAKTVEHHVARIRRRLGAESRSEMLSMLRAMVAPQG